MLKPNVYCKMALLLFQISRRKNSFAYIFSDISFVVQKDVKELGADLRGVPWGEEERGKRLTKHI